MNRCLTLSQHVIVCLLLMSHT